MEVTLRPTGDIQGGFRNAPHTVDIAEGVRRRDCPERIGVIYDRREVVYRVNECDLIRKPVDSRIVGGFSADKEVRVCGLRDVI